MLIINDIIIPIPDTESVTLIYKGTSFTVISLIIEYALHLCLTSPPLGNCYISLEVKGYDFTLMVRSEAEIPNDLKMTKGNITELSKATKAIISVATKLQEMIDWLLKKEESMTTQLETTDHSHQDKKRLLDNLKENLREARRAKELSPKYRKEAGNLLNEAAVLSGITP